MKTATTLLVFALFAVSGCLRSEDEAASQSQHVVADSESCSPIPMHKDVPLHDAWSGPFFEGWYLRLTPSSGDSLVAIVGIRQTDVGDHYAFVQLIDKGGATSHVKMWPLEAWPTLTEQTADDFLLKAGGFELSANSLKVAWDDGPRGPISFAATWTRCSGFGDWGDDGGPTMHWAQDVPGVPLKWHVVATTGPAQATLRVGEQVRNLTGAQVHFEKNWGRSFPDYWTWMQVHDAAGDALTFSGGPAMDFSHSPEAYMFNLRRAGENFTFYTHGTARFDVAPPIKEGDEIVWMASVQNPWYRLELRASAATATFLPIITPEDDGLRWGAAETFSGKVEWLLLKKKNVWNPLSPYEPVDEGVFEHSALELGGHYAQLLDN